MKAFAIGIAITVSVVSTIFIVGVSTGRIINPIKANSKTVAINKQKASKQPQKNNNYKDINVGAESAIIYDVNSGKVLYAKNENSTRPIASLTKLMTALVVIKENKPNEIVKVGDMPALDLYDQKIGITKGEEFKLIDLLKALIIYSANDAANALAIHNSGSIKNFATKMNDQAEKWGLNSSNFTNPSGLDENGSGSSANDILKIALILYNNDLFRKVELSKEDTISNTSGKSYGLKTTNLLLGNNSVVGGKTGYTLNAGPCLITVAQKDGNTIMTVVLNSENRFQETANMIEWAFNNYTWQ